jgi:hypothetical protein
VKEVLLEGHGHLLPQEAPSKCADAAAEWIETEITRWKTDEMTLMKGWAEKNPREKCCPHICLSIYPPYYPERKTEKRRKNSPFEPPKKYLCFSQEDPNE